MKKLDEEQKKMEQKEKDEEGQFSALQKVRTAQEYKRGLSNPLGPPQVCVQQSKLLDTYLWRVNRVEIVEAPKRLLNASMILNDSGKECFS